MIVAGGQLMDVLGPARAAGDFSFVPAVVEIDRGAIDLETALARDPRTEAAQGALRQLLDDELDAIWARARILSIFGVDSPPENERLEKSLMSFGFVAVPLGQEEVGYAFECSDVYGSSRLRFREDEPAADVKAAIAMAFWGLLLSAPDEVAEYSDRAFHPGAGIFMAYGIRGGEIFFHEDDGG